MTTATLQPCKSGGVMVDVGDEFPRWFATAGEARSYLLRLDLERGDRIPVPHAERP